MDGSFIPAGVQELWSVWNIRGFVILSLFLQVLLTFMAWLRKKSNNRLIIFVIWSAYSMADWAATYTFGLISNARCNNSISPPQVNENLLAFWAAFLLIHLGGPDMVTSFSLEDNALWMRHVVGLVAQVFTFLYIFVKTLPDNNLVAPTILVAVAGAIKYGERTRALYLVSMENLKKSWGKPPDNGFAGFYVDASKEAFYYFQIFKRLVVDITPNSSELKRSQQFILSNGDKRAFHVMVGELNLLYQMFYSKIVAAYSAWGIVARTITYYNVIAALVLYCLSKKEGFHEVDIWITFLLMAGAVALEMLNGFVLVVSDWDFSRRWYSRMWYIAQGLCIFIPVMVFMPRSSLYKRFAGQEGNISNFWCEKLGAFNLLSHCFVQCRQRDNKLKEYSRTIFRFVACKTDGNILRNAFDEEIQKFIFYEVQSKGVVIYHGRYKMQTVFEARGSWTLMNLGNNGELIKYVDPFDYDKSLLAWHVATEICYNTDGAVDDATESNHKKLAKILSDYMNYLLIKKPKMMSDVAGTISQKMYTDTCSEIAHFRRSIESSTVNEFCTKVMDGLMSHKLTLHNRNKGESVFSDACHLAIDLRPNAQKWEIISKVWVEMLMYAAGHCRPKKHVGALIDGCELVTIVWLLMAHLGIGLHFSYPDN